MGRVRGDRRIRYARVNDADVAYRVDGNGPEDLLLIPGLLNHIESAATVPEVGRHYERLAHFARVVLYDQRGTQVFRTGDGIHLRSTQGIAERLETSA